MNNIAPYAKSLVAALVAGLSVLATSLDNDSISAQEGVYAAIAFFTALAAVFAVPNRDPSAQHQRDSVQPPERGAVDIVTALVVVILVVVLLVLLGVLR